MGYKKNLYKKRRRAYHTKLTSGAIRNMVERERPKILIDDFDNPFQNMDLAQKSEYLDKCTKSEHRYGSRKNPNLSLYFDITSQMPKPMVVQILVIKYFRADEDLTNIVAKMMLSDGVSSVLSILPEKVYQAMNKKELKPLDVIGIFGFETKELNKDAKVIIITEPPQIFFKHVPDVLGSPKEYNDNLTNGFLDVEESKLEVSEKVIFDNNYYPQVKKDEEGLTPISSLNQYSGNYWSIKARVLKKGKRRHWKNQRGEGYLCTIDLIDKHGTEIQATLFNDQCDQYEEMLEVNVVYTFSGGAIKPANRQYSNLNNEFQINFDKKTMIEKSSDDGIIQKCIGNYLTLAEVQSIPPQEMCDIRAVVHLIGRCTKMNMKSGEEKIRRNVMIVDDTGYSICICFWGESAQRLELEGNPVITVKNCKVAEFAGKSLNANHDSIVIVDQDSLRAIELREWYDKLNEEDISRIIQLSLGTGMELQYEESKKQVTQPVKQGEPLESKNRLKFNDEELTKIPNTNVDELNNEFEEFMALQNGELIPEKTKKVEVDNSDMISEVSRSEIENSKCSQDTYKTRSPTRSVLSQETCTTKSKEPSAVKSTDESVDLFVVPKLSKLDIIHEEIEDDCDSFIPNIKPVTQKRGAEDIRDNISEHYEENQKQTEAVENKIETKKHRKDKKHKKDKKKKKSKKESKKRKKSKREESVQKPPSKRRKVIEDDAEEDPLVTKLHTLRKSAVETAPDHLIFRGYDSDLDVDAEKKPRHVNFSDDEDMRTKSQRQLLNLKTKQELIYEDLDFHELAEMKKESLTNIKSDTTLKKEEPGAGNSLPQGVKFEEMQAISEERNSMIEEIVKERKRYYFMQNKKKRWRKQLEKLGPDGIPEDERLRLEANKLIVKNEEELAEMHKRPKRIWYTRYQFFKRIKEYKELSRRSRSSSAIGADRINDMRSTKALADMTLGSHNNLYNSRQRWRRPDLRPMWMYDKEYRNSKLQAMRNVRLIEEQESNMRKQDYAENNQGGLRLPSLAKKGRSSYKYSNYRDGNRRQDVASRGNSRWYQ